jgi:hypothetical protein
MEAWDATYSPFMGEPKNRRERIMKRYPMYRYIGIAYSDGRDAKRVESFQWNRPQGYTVLKDAIRRLTGLEGILETNDWK